MQHSFHAAELMKRYALMSIGIFITAVGVYFFKFPNNFSTGGVSGISLILGRVLHSTWLTPSMFMLILNMVLLLLGLVGVIRRRRAGKEQR